MSDARVDAEVGAINLDEEQADGVTTPATSESTPAAAADAAKDETGKEGGGE